MKISVIGTNGMLSTALTKYFFGKESTTVETYGLEAPNGYDCDKYYQVDLNNDKLDYDTMCNYDVIIYAAGAGVQAAQKTASSLMYALILLFTLTSAALSANTTFFASDATVITSVPTKL